MSVFKSLKRLGSDTLIYGLGSVLQALIGFLLFPIYTRVLSQADFGAQDLLMTFSIIINYFLILGLDSGAARYYYDTDDEKARKTYLSSWLWLEILYSIPVVLLLAVFAEPVCETLFSNRNLVFPFRLIVLSIPFALIIRVVNLTLRLTFRAKAFSLLTGFGLLTQAAAAVIFVVAYHMGIAGVFLAILCANIIQVLVGLALTVKNFLPRLSLVHIKAMLIFGLPLVPASLSIWVLNYSNRYFLSKWTSLEEVALFGAAYRINALLTVGITAFQNAWPPFAFSMFADETAAKKVYQRTLTYFILGAMAASVVLSLFAREALLVLATHKYESSYRLVPLLLSGTIAWGAIGIVSIACEIRKKSYQITVATFLGALITILLNALCIPIFGLHGAALAAMLGNILALIYIYRIGQKYFFVEYELGRLLKMILISVFVMSLGVLLDFKYPLWVPAILVFKTTLLLVFFISTFAFHVITPEEVTSVQVLVKQKLGAVALKK